MTTQWTAKSLGQPISSSTMKRKVIDEARATGKPFDLERDGIFYASYPAVKILPKVPPSPMRQPHNSIVKVVKGVKFVACSRCGKTIRPIYKTDRPAGHVKPGTKVMCR